MSDRRRVLLPGRLLLALALIAATCLGSRGITSEGAVSMHGDMPRYLMNGVFFYDFLRSGTAWTPSAALDYAQHYFVRYPALSIGHHPPLLPIALVPFYAVFGISVFSARLAILSFFLLSVWLVYKLGRRLYDDHAAGWAALIFATSPLVVRFGQEVMSEMPTIALALLSLRLLFRFCDSGRAVDYALFVVSVIASLCAKQLAALLFPLYLIVFATSERWRKFQQRDVMLMTAIGAALVAPIAIATIAFSPFNVTAFQEIATRWRGLATFGAVFEEIVEAQLTTAVIVAMAAACVTSFLRRDRTIGFSLAWMLTVVGAVIVLIGPNEPARYTILAIPAYALCAASLVFGPRTRRARWIGPALLAVAVFSQVEVARARQPIGADGYEEAARFVMSHERSATILYSGPVDTGYFVFFVRKHDPMERAIVLRSDKLLTTSLMSDLSVEDRIGSAEEIYPLLRRFGTRFVVIADSPTGSRVLDWLRDETKTSHFTERLRIPIVSRDPRLRGHDLVVYEYNDAQPPAADAEIDLRIPLVGREIRVPLADLLPAPQR